MKVVKYLSVLVFGVLNMMVLTACSTEGNDPASDYVDELQLIHMGAGDISLVTDFEQLVMNRSHVMRVDVLDARVERIENPIAMPGNYLLEWMVALEFRQDLIDWTRDTLEWLEENVNSEDVPPNPPAVRTIYQVEILEIFHRTTVFHEWQPAVGDIIEVTRYGGIYGHEHWISGLADLEIGSEYILFLNRCWQYEHRFDASFIQGAYRVPVMLADGESLLEYDNVDLEIESIGWGNEFEITIEDFIDLATGELTSSQSRRRRMLRQNRRTDTFVHETSPLFEAHFNVFGVDERILWITLVNHGIDVVYTDLEFTVEVYNNGVWEQLSQIDSSLSQSGIFAIPAQEYSVFRLLTDNFPPLEVDRLYRLTMVAWLVDEFDTYHWYEMDTKFYMFEVPEEDWWPVNIQPPAN